MAISKEKVIQNLKNRAYFVNDRFDNVAFRKDLKAINYDLSDAVLRSANLRGADLSGANLRGASLSWAFLSDAVLRAADLRGAVLSSTNLSGADLGWAFLRDAVLRDADLKNARFYGADITNVKFTNPRVKEAVTLATIKKGPERIATAIKLREQRMLKPELMLVAARRLSNWQRKSLEKKGITPPSRLPKPKRLSTKRFYKPRAFR